MSSAGGAECSRSNSDPRWFGAASYRYSKRVWSAELNSSSCSESVSVKKFEAGRGSVQMIHRCIGATVVVFTCFFLRLFRPFRRFECFSTCFGVALPDQCISIFCWYSTSCIICQLAHARQQQEDEQSSHLVPSMLYLVRSFLRVQHTALSPHKQQHT